MAQQRAAVAAPGAAVHAGERARLSCGQPRRASRPSAAHGRSSPSAGGRLRSGPRMSASVSACSPWPGWVNRSPQKKVLVRLSISRPQSQPCGTCGVSSHRTRVPAEDDLLAVGERARRAVGDVAHRDHRRDLAAERRRLRRDGEQFVERAALVGLEVREADIAQPLHRHDARRPPRAPAGTSGAARCGRAAARRRRAGTG